MARRRLAAQPCSEAWNGTAARRADAAVATETDPPAPTKPEPFDASQLREPLVPRATSLVHEQRRVWITPQDALQRNEDGRAGGRARIWAFGRSFLHSIALLDVKSTSPRSFWKNRRIAAGLREDDMFESFAFAVRLRLEFRPDRTGALALVAAALHHLAAVLAGRDAQESRAALRAAALRMVEACDADGNATAPSTLPGAHEPE